MICWFDASITFDCQRRGTSSKSSAASVLLRTLKVQMHTGTGLTYISNDKLDGDDRCYQPHQSNAADQLGLKAQIPARRLRYLLRLVRYANFLEIKTPRGDLRALTTDSATGNQPLTRPSTTKFSGLSSWFLFLKKTKSSSLD